MERGSYIAASGGMLELRKLDVVTNNLANLNTPGFKRQLLVGETQSFDKTLASVTAANDPYAKGDHDRSPAAVNLQTVTDFSPGPIKNTGNTFDFALRNPNDFFAISTPEGIQYTRAGNFTLDSSGQIVTQDGYPLQGDGGPITVDGPNISVSGDGSIRSGLDTIGQISVVRIEDPSSLERVGASRFILKAGQGAPQTVDTDIIPKSLEMSNVTAVANVIELISANRAFDLYTKSAQSIDQINQTAISQVGRPR